MAPAPPERYRKLPGTRRGFVRRSSVWMGSDHLLLANSVRFREDYKRFYFRDVQAIVIAGAPRFEISVRVLTVALIGLIGWLTLRSRLPYGDTLFWVAAAALAGAWVYVSAACSCRCRIYTAVSRDELPSVYRSWIARRFLEKVEPRIGQTQGVVEGNWAEAAEFLQVGPALAKPIPGPAAIPAGAAAPEAPEAAGPVVPTRAAASDIFVANLFVVGLLDVFTLHSTARWLLWISYALAFVQTAAAVAIFIDYRRGRLRRPMQRLAVATLIVMGASFYVRQIMASLVSGNRFMPDLNVLAQQPGYILAREISAAVWLVLALVGAGISLLTRGENG